VHPDDRAVAETDKAEIATGAAFFKKEFRIVRPDGAIRHIESCGKVLLDPTGQPLRVIGVNLDISDRKQAELELAEAHQRLQALMQNSPALIGLYDETGRYQQVNPITSAFLGLPEAEIVGRRFDEVHSPEVATLFMERVRQVADSDRPLIVEDRLMLHDREHVFRSVLFPVLTPPGQPKLLGMVATDITALMAAQDRLQRQAERERLVREITVNIRRSLDLDAILESTVTGVRRFLKTDRVLVYRFNPDWSGHMVVESVHSGWTSVLGETLRDPCFEGALVEQYRQGHIGQIQDVESAAIAPCHRDLLTHYQVRANLVLPLVIDQALWGLLCIHHCQAPRDWLPDEIAFVQQIAEQVELAIQQAKLLQETTIRAQRERLRGLITQHIRRSLELDAILETTVQEIRQFLNTDRVVIYQFAPDRSGDIVFESVASGWTEVLGSTLRDPCFTGELIEKYRAGAISRLDDVEAAPLEECYRKFLTQFEIRANLVLPLVVDDTLWGLLCIHHCCAPRHWDDEEITFVQQICDQVEIAIQQAQLLKQAEQRAQREQLFSEIMTTVRESLDLQEMMNRTTEKLMAAFQVSRCMVSLCSDDGAFLECSAASARPGMRTLRHQRLPIAGNPLAEYVLSATTPVAKADLFHDDWLTTAASNHVIFSLAQRFDVVAVLAISIRYQGQVKGVLAVHHNVPRPWSEDDCQLIQQVADQLAIAIQQAELYQQAQAEIAERLRLEEQLRHDAFHDALTGLPNRALFLDRLQFALQRFQRWRRRPQGRVAPSLTPSDRRAPPQAQFAVLFLDLDRFKVINDSLGHSFGDQLLKLVASRLLNCIRDVDTAARLGGDEFVILLEEVADRGFAIEVARRIHNILEVPIFLDNREVFIRASIGIAFGSTRYSEPNQILRDADIAMYQAKQSSQEYVVFDASMHTIALQQMNLENDLRHAIKRQEFKLHYQPVISLVTGKIVSFEALVRWQHPTRGLLYPGAFVEVAEETGLIAAIDLWVLQEACQQLYRWQTQSSEWADLTMGVNLSGKQFSQPELINQIDHALASTHLDGRYLKLEITESVLIENNDLAIQTLDAFRARNIQVCMDDFGTGYSSLSYLHRFPVDILKIDKSFILNLSSRHASSRDYEIVKAIINLAINLNLQVVAEGIENQDVLVYLQKNRCQFGQGYYFSPAVDCEAATELLRSQPF
jgi:diguanylate cyclase (GGDEF)-like protein/PAS domain S-box-containing protein